MRKALLVLALVGLALPAAAQENPCATVNIDFRDSGQPFVASLDYEPGAPVSSVVGHFVWFSWTYDHDFGGEETLSFDASNLESAVACADGTVTLVEVVSDAGTDFNPPSPAPAPEPVSLRPVCEVYASTLEYTCTLPNLTLRIS